MRKTSLLYKLNKFFYILIDKIYINKFKND